MYHWAKGGSFIFLLEQQKKECILNHAVLSNFKELRGNNHRLKVIAKFIY